MTSFKETLHGGISRRQLVQTSAAVAAAGTAVSFAAGQTMAAPNAAAAAQTSIDEVIIAIGADTRVMDPDLDQGLTDMYQLIFNAPFGTNADGSAKGDLASTWEYLDDTTLQVVLRQDAFWHDDTPLTSADFVFTWERMKSPDRESTNYPRFSPWLADVVAIDDFTVQFKTIEAFAPALDSLQGFWIAPKQFIEQVGDDAFGLKPLGSGPYKVTEWQKDQFLSLEAASSWKGQAQPFPKVKFVIITDTFTRTAALLSGDVHVAEAPPTAMVEQIEGSGSAYLSVSPDLRIQFIQFPYIETRHENTPEIDNKLVRQALNYAIDRETIATVVGQGYFEVVAGPWPKSSWAYPDNAAELGYTYDPEKAKQLLADAGYADGFTLYFGTSNGFSLMDNELMTACVPYFEDIGLKVEFSSLEWASFDPARDDKQFSAYYLGLSGSADPYEQPNSYMTSQGRTRGFYSTDPELEAVIWEGAKIVDFEARKTYYHETVFPKTLDAAPWIFLWTPSTIVAVDNKISYTQSTQPFIDVMSMTVTG